MRLDETLKGQKDKHTLSGLCVRPDVICPNIKRSDLASLILFPIV